MFNARNVKKLWSVGFWQGIKKMNVLKVLFLARSVKKKFIFVFYLIIKIGKKKKSVRAFN